MFRMITKNVVAAFKREISTTGMQNSHELEHVFVCILL